MNDVSKGELIERRIDREIAATTELATRLGGLRVSNMLEVMEFSKVMAVSGAAVPAHLRNNPGACMAICLQAIEWNMSPFAVANKSYVTNDRLNYESQLVHAVIEARAPLRERLQARYEGEGDERVCIVYGTFKGEVKPREHRSPPLKVARPPMGDRGRKGSPLWDKKPDVQLFYDTSRDFCRIYCPDVLLGIYTPDEVEQYGIGEQARDVTSESAALAERLSANATPPQRVQEGFRQDAVERVFKEGETVAATVPDTKPQEPATPPKRKPGRPRNPPPETVDQGGKIVSVTVTNPGPQTAESEIYPDSEREKEVVTNTDVGSQQSASVVDKTPAVAEQPTLPPRRQPTNVREYADWLDIWLNQCKTEQEVDDRWAAEVLLRNKCGVVDEERKAMVMWVEDRKKELRGKDGIPDFLRRKT